MIACAALGMGLRRQSVINLNLEICLLDTRVNYEHIQSVIMQ